MTKKTYEKPVLHAEQFIPNNYCNVCWGVACAAAYESNLDYGNQTVYANLAKTQTFGWGENQQTKTTYLYYTGGYDGGIGENWQEQVSHRESQCGQLTNQYISMAEDGTVSLTETGTDGLGKLSGTLDAGNSYTAGSVIKWTTTAGSKTWHHWGYVQLTESGRPNMS